MKNLSRVLSKSKSSTFISSCLPHAHPRFVSVCSCEKRFSRSDELTRHSRIHQTDRGKKKAAAQAAAIASGKIKSRQSSRANSPVEERDDSPEPVHNRQSQQLPPQPMMPYVSHSRLILIPMLTSVLLQPYGYPPPGYWPQMSMPPMAYPYYPPPMPNQQFPQGYAPPPPGYYNYPIHPQQQQQPQQQIQQPTPVAPEPRPLNALLAAASGEMEREREKEERDTKVGIINSASSTPYGSYDQGQHSWPYTQQQQQPHYLLPSQPNEEMRHPTSTSRATRKHSTHHPQLVHPSLPHQDDHHSRHSHSHNPSNPQHHSSLSRTQHRHAYSPYNQPTSTDHSTVNSPTHSDQDDEDHLAGNGIGFGTLPGQGQSQAIGQLQQALAYHVPASNHTSPVLGPLKGLSLMSAAASRAGSRSHSRASSPIHLPPLNLHSSDYNGGGNSAPGSRNSGSGNTSHDTSLTGSPDNRSNYHPHHSQQSFTRTDSNGNGSYQNGSHSHLPSLSSSLSSMFNNNNQLPHHSTLNNISSNSSSNFYSGNGSSSSFFPSGPSSRHTSPPTTLSTTTEVNANGSNGPTSQFSSITNSSDSLSSLGGSNGREFRTGFGLTKLNN